MGIYMIDVNGLSIKNISPKNSDVTYQCPSSIAIDCSNNIYVLDSERKEIILLNPSGEFMEVLINNNPQNTFRLPTAITIDPSNNLYIFDTTTDDTIDGSIYKYDHQNLLKISPIMVNNIPDISYGVSYSMTFFHEKLYIMDAEQKCIIRIESDGSNPEVITPNTNDVDNQPIYI
jgi:DNA-binding beta-propeller fold protein YncE